MIPEDATIRKLFSYYSMMFIRKERAVFSPDNLSYENLLKWNLTRTFFSEPTFDSMHGTRHVWMVMNRKYRKYGDRYFS